MENHRKGVKMIKKGSKRPEKGQNQGFGRVWYGFGRFWLLLGFGEKVLERSLRGGYGRVCLSYHLRQVSNWLGTNGVEGSGPEDLEKGSKWHLLVVLEVSERSKWSFLVQKVIFRMFEGRRSDEGSKRSFLGVFGGGPGEVLEREFE